jgi:hypothetical protein
MDITTLRNAKAFGRKPKGAVETVLASLPDDVSLQLK